MVAIKTKFDGEKIVLPEQLQGCPPQDVIIICETDATADAHAWMRAQENSFAKAWDSDEDAVYDEL